eukprot:765512-Hanusia_phi.AAC.1
MALKTFPDDDVVCVLQQQLAHRDAAGNTIQALMNARHIHALVPVKKAGPIKLVCVVFTRDLNDTVAQTPQAEKDSKLSKYAYVEKYREEVRTRTRTRTMEEEREEAEAGLKEERSRSVGASARGKWRATLKGLKTGRGDWCYGSQSGCSQDLADRTGPTCREKRLAVANSLSSLSSTAS